MIEILDIPIYNTSVCLCIGVDGNDIKILAEDNPQKIGREVCKEIVKDIEDESICDGFVRTLDDGVYFLYIREGCEYSPRVVFHELFHLTNYILCDRDVTHDKYAEAWAYLLGWIAEQYYTIVNKNEDEKVQNNPQ